MAHHVCGCTYLAHSLDTGQNETRMRLFEVSTEGKWGRAQSNALVRNDLPYRPFVSLFRLYGCDFVPQFASAILFPPATEQPMMKAIWARLHHRNRLDERKTHKNGDDQEDEATHQDMVVTCRPTWSFVLRTVLCGVHDPESPLSILRGFEDTLLRYIYEIAMSTWIDLVTLTSPAYSVGRMRSSSFRVSRDDSQDSLEEREGRGRLLHVTFQGQYRFSKVGHLVADRPQIAYSPCGRIEFPSAQDVNVNMLPFVLGDPSSLPAELLPYYPLIEKCRVLPEEMGKVCYLTVCESYVGQDATQRRGGLHIEAPHIKLKSSFFVAGEECHWGQGFAFSEDELHGGLYMASSVSNTCAVYDALVDKKGVDSHGGMDHLRRLIGEPTLLEANELVWLTDCTPHEALPQEEPAYRQFFRLVTSKISLWYEGNSTANPKVPLPDYVQVIPGSKFDKE